MLVLEGNIATELSVPSLVSEITGTETPVGGGPAPESRKAKTEKAQQNGQGHIRIAFGTEKGLEDEPRQVREIIAALKSLKVTTEGKLWTRLEQKGFKTCQPISRVYRFYKKLMIEAGYLRVLDEAEAPAPKKARKAVAKKAEPRQAQPPTIEVPAEIAAA